VRSQVFHEHAPKLGTSGRMLVTAGFTYEGSMNASELMEPKLDAGMRRPAKSVVDRLIDGELSTEIDSGEALLAVFDKLFNFEVGWAAPGGRFGCRGFSCVWMRASRMQVCHSAPLWTVR
jgi:hypothetical protein